MNIALQLLAPVRTTFEVTVAIAQGTDQERELRASIAGWIFPPANVPVVGTPALWYLCIPGATYRGLSYFDRQVNGHAPEEFSIARFLARQGIGLVVIDTLGTGESEVEIDGTLITRHVTAKANAQVLDQIRERLTTGRLVAGLDIVAEDALFLGAFGHSMGAFQLTQLAALLEDRGTPLDAAIFVGWTHGPVDYGKLHLDANAFFAALVATNGYYTIPRSVMRPVFYGPHSTVLRDLIEADEQDAIAVPRGLLDEVVLPGIVAREAAGISCPVLYIVAEHDFGTNPQVEGEIFRATRLFTAYTQPKAAHCNFEESRREFWLLLAYWSRMVAQLRSGGAGEQHKEIL